MNPKSNELIAGLFSDVLNIQILCSIYDNEVTADAIANLLNLSEEEIKSHLETLCKIPLVIKRQNGNNIVYGLINSRVCDSILSLRDSIEYSGRTI